MALFPRAPLDIVSSATGVSPLTTGGTLTFQYPAARAASHYAGQWPARMNVRALQGNYIQDTDFTISYGVANITVTWLATTPIPANVPVGLQIPVRIMHEGFDEQPIMPPVTADSQYIVAGNVVPTQQLTPEIPPTIIGL